MKDLKAELVAYLKAEAKYGCEVPFSAETGEKILEVLSIWHTFDTLPDEGRPILVIEFSFAEEDEGKSFYSAHIWHGFAEEVPFGVEIIRSDWLNRQNEQISHKCGTGLKEYGRWAYVADVIRSAGLPNLANIFVNGDRPFEGRLAGEQFNP